MLVRGLLLAGCACLLLWNASAVTRTGGLTTPGNAVPPQGGLLRLGAANNLALDENFLRCVVPMTNADHRFYRVRQP
jgi:hypothetical protein